MKVKLISKFLNYIFHVPSKLKREVLIVNFFIYFFFQAVPETAGIKFPDFKSAGVTLRSQRVSMICPCRCITNKTKWRVNFKPLLGSIILIWEFKTLLLDKKKSWNCTDRECFCRFLSNTGTLCCGLDFKMICKKLNDVKDQQIFLFNPVVLTSEEW